MMPVDLDTSETDGLPSVLKKAATLLEEASSMASAGDTPKPDNPPEPEKIRYSLEYVGKEAGSVLVHARTAEVDPSKEPPVFEYVEVRLSSQDRLSSTSKPEDLPKTDKGKGHAYINILSPAVAEALRCVVDYYPGLDLSGNVIKVPEPYCVFVFFEKELAEYRRRSAALATANSSSCSNRWADKHIGIVQDFVREQVQGSVDAERARHSRGYATFDMLWLLYKPGSDVYCDIYELGEHDPYVISSVNFDLVNGATDSYDFNIWDINADSMWVGPEASSRAVQHFTGEKRITTLVLYPCEYVRFADNVTPDDVSAIRQHFVNRGRKWYSLRQKVSCHYFDGVTVSLPRRVYTSLGVVDPKYYTKWGNKEKTSLLPNVEQPPGPLKICTCNKCEEVIYPHAVKPRFKAYAKVNPEHVESLTDHQYFLCDPLVETFLFSVRCWQYLHVDGFREPRFENTLFGRLVMKSSTKDLIKNLVHMYIRDSSEPHKRGQQMYKTISDVHRSEGPKKAETSWSPDFIDGKGEGLTILLHGRPGVGKTYTAECIAELTERPLLSLTCSDIGVKPETIEENLVRWFKAAESWGAIILIDEADIYMEERRVQDIERNHLVAGFLRALEYYKGILFLTTNRVGTFDEAFMSRIHVQIHYPNFDDEERARLWDTFFEKLEEDRETTMRITQSAKDYVQSHEMRSLEWNGREIRNSFQVAVALAEAQGQKDKEGRTLIKSDHIKATVQMSKEFRSYLFKVHKADPSKRAAMMGNRYDAYGKNASTSTDKY